MLWIDAHADANTPETSPSLHYHGMPAAHVLGCFNETLKGFEWLLDGRKEQRTPTALISESRLAYIGLRDIDKEEGRMLRESGVHIYTMREIDKFGIANVVDMALQNIDPTGERPLHLTLDVDAIDPQFAPGTGTTSRGGLTYREVHYICEECAATDRLVGMDLVEVNPGLDPSPPQGRKDHGDNPNLKRTTPTVQLGMELILSALGKEIGGG